MKGLNSKKVSSFEDTNRELDNIRQLLQSIPDSAATSGGVPSGTVLAFAGTTAPTGYLLCNGAIYSSSQYPALFSVIGNSTWGNNPTSSTFKVPDLRAASIRGAGTSTVFTSNATIALGQIVDDKLQGHWHNMKGGTSGGTRAYWTTSGAGTTYSDDDNVRAPVTDGTNGTPRTGLETTGKAIGLNWIIKI